MTTTTPAPEAGATDEGGSIVRPSRMDAIGYRDLLEKSAERFRAGMLPLDGAVYLGDAIQWALAEIDRNAEAIAAWNKRQAGAGLLTMDEAAHMRDQAVMQARKEWYRADRATIGSLRAAQAEPRTTNDARPDKQPSLEDRIIAVLGRRGPDENLKETDHLARELKVSRREIRAATDAMNKAHIVNYLAGESDYFITLTPEGWNRHAAQGALGAGGEVE